MAKESRAHRAMDQAGALIIRAFLISFGILGLGVTVGGASFGIYRAVGGNKNFFDFLSNMGPAIAAALGITLLVSHTE